MNYFKIGETFKYKNKKIRVIKTPTNYWIKCDYCFFHKIENDDCKPAPECSSKRRPDKTAVYFVEVQE